MKGAKKDIQDASGMTPIEIAHEILGDNEVLRPTLKLVTDMLSE